MRRGKAAWLLLWVVMLVVIASADLPADYAGTENSGGYGPMVMVWVDTNPCDRESAECRRHDGPHPVISYDTSGFDPAAMRVHLFLDGSLLAAMSEAEGGASVLMRSPHEQQTPTDGRHYVEARILASDGEDSGGGARVLARDGMYFVFDLTDVYRPRIDAARTSATGSEGVRGEQACPVMEGSKVAFDYRGGDGHGTHQPVLYAALQATAGDVIEFGMGYYSTPMLHDLCAAAGRQLVSLDTDESWVDRFRWLGSASHRIMHVESWEGDVEVEALYAREWGLALVDQHPEAARVQVCLVLCIDLSIYLSVCLSMCV